jgi:Right handed beta helix region
MTPRPAMEESNRGSQSVILPGQFVRLTTTLAVFLLASWSAPASNATALGSSLGPSCHGVQVAPGDDLQGLIDSHHRRSTFCFAPGMYQLSTTVWTGNKFPRLNLRAGAVIDGNNGSFESFNGLQAPPDRPGMIVLGGVFQHFASGLFLNRNAVVDGTEFRENFAIGLGILGDNARASNVHTHHNGQYGLTVTIPCVGCPVPKGVIIEDSEIAFNNTRHLDPGIDAGGTKFSAGTDGMIVRRNKVHDNHGMGLWWDGSNKNARVYGNRIYDNRNAGILYEISFGGTRIHHNKLIDNGTGDGTDDWTLNVQLGVASSDGSRGGRGGIEIYANRIDGAAYPLGIVTHAGRLTAKQVHVHNNLLILRAGSSRVGGDDQSGTGEMFRPSAGNRFRANTYWVLDPKAAYWAWNGEMLTWAQWQAIGHDDNGVVERVK